MKKKKTLARRKEVIKKKPMFFHKWVQHVREAFPSSQRWYTYVPDLFYLSITLQFTKIKRPKRWTGM